MNYRGYELSEAYCTSKGDVNGIWEAFKPNEENGLFATGLQNLKNEIDEQIILEEDEY